MKKKKKKERKKKNFKKDPRNQNPCHPLFSGGIICGSGSFAVQFGDHLRSGIICGAVQTSYQDNVHVKVLQILRFLFFYSVGRDFVMCNCVLINSCRT